MREVPLEVVMYICIVQYMYARTYIHTVSYTYVLYMNNTYSVQAH